MWTDGEDMPKGVSLDKKTGQWKVPTVRGISIEDEREAEAYLIADNRLTEAGSWDQHELAGLLSDLAAAGVPFEGIGYDTDDLDAMLEDLGQGDGTGDWPEMPEGERDELQQMSFVLHETQVALVKKALKKCKEGRSFDGSPNENSNGNALAAIVEEWMSGQS
jgi:hypothetical protein